MAMSRLGKAALCVLCATLLALPGYGRADIAKAFADTALPLATQHDAEGAVPGGDDVEKDAVDIEWGKDAGNGKTGNVAEGSKANDEAANTTLRGPNDESDEAFNALGIVPVPDGDTAGAFVVTGGAYEIVADGALVLTESATYTVGMAEGTAKSPAGIRVDAGAAPTVTLDSVSIDTTDKTGMPAFLVEGDGAQGSNTTTLLLKGESALISAEGCAGVQKEGADRTLVIDSGEGPGTTAGTLNAKGGYGGAGIGTGHETMDDSIARHIEINGGTVIATGGYGAAGIGSGYAENDHSIASHITIRGGEVSAQSGAHAAGIGSGYTGAEDGMSSAVNIAIEGGAVVASSQVKNGSGGAAIGSGYADQGSSAASGIAVVGGSVTATAGTDADGAGGAPGIGAGPAIHGASTATGITLSGNVIALGGATNAEGVGPVTLPAVGAGSALERTAVDTVIASVNGLRANAWKGASASDARQFLTMATEPYALDGFGDAYLKVELAAVRPVDPNAGSSAQPLASTGDETAPLAAGLATLLAALATTTAAASVLHRRRAGHAR